MAAKQQRKKAPEAILFGETLRRFRTERGWSQERLAEAAGITLNYVGNLERGEQGPSLNVLLRISRALDIDASSCVAVFTRDLLSKMKL